MRALLIRIACGWLVVLGLAWAVAGPSEPNRPSAAEQARQVERREADLNAAYEEEQRQASYHGTGPGNPHPTAGWEP